MYEFDGLVSAEAERRRIRYTRYADDMTFSGQRIGMLKDMVSIVPEALKTVTYPKLQLNEAKTTFVTAAFRRVVTGVVLANDGTVSLGRDKKRLLRAQVHRASLGALPADELQQLAGYLSFVNVVEPEFLARLRDRYGAPLIKRIQRAADIPEGAPKGDGF
jgi:RNA-directed DNA polymerase